MTGGFVLFCVVGFTLNFGAFILTLGNTILLYDSILIGISSRLHIQ